MSAGAQISWDDAPQIKWDDEAKGIPANDPLKTGVGMEHPTDPTIGNAAEHMHGAISLMGRPASSLAADKRFESDLTSRAPVPRTMGQGLAGTPPETPAGMEDISHIAQSVPALAGAAAGFEGTPAFADSAAEGLGNLRNSAARLLREPYTGNLKPAVPRLPFARWATEALVPRGEEGSITNPIKVPMGGTPPSQAGTYYRPTATRRVQEPFTPMGPTRVNKADIQIATPEAPGTSGTESEGRYATIAGDRLRQMAPSDPAAIRQLNQRGVKIPMVTSGQPLIHTGEFGGIHIPENTISGRKIVIPPPQ